MKIYSIKILCIYLLFFLFSAPLQAKNSDPDLEKTYKATTTMGQVGTTSEKLVDYAFDNLFAIDLEELSLEQYQYKLKFEIRGVDGHSATFSLNDELAMGGLLQVKKTQWSGHEQILSAESLRSGKK